jgi:hypothetical protein
LVDLDVERKRDVVPHELEVMMIEQVLDVTPSPSEEIVDAYDIGTAPHQPVAKMRAEEAGAPRN